MLIVRSFGKGITMVTVPRPPPTAEQQRKYNNAHDAWGALVSDPEAVMERARARPIYVAREGDLLEAKKENWKKRKGSKDVRPEGSDYVMVRRCPETGRFTKGSRSTLGKQKKTGRKFITTSG